jgi:PAB-dependent poly(A)-specific ribonuclease subunit 3
MLIAHSLSKFNAESPSFTPLQPHVNGQRRSKEYPTISPRSANATPFTPKATVNEVTISGFGDAKEPFKTGMGKEFHPASFEPESSLGQDVSADPAMMGYDAYSLQSAYQGLSGQQQPALHNPYLQDPYSNPNYYQAMQSFAAPLQHHLYAHLPPHRENLHGYQRMTHDFFIPEDLRREYQKRLEATLQVMPGSHVLPNLEHFHSLVPLDGNSNKVSPLFDYQTWIYKATSSKDGKTYAIRRIAGFRLTNENAVRALQPWKKINSGGMVMIHDVFTTRAFGDSSLLFVTDYHPCSETLNDHYLHRGYRNGHHHTKGQHANQHVPEPVLWAYIVQLASALKPIHAAGLAARIINPSKILVTSKNRIRLNACGMLDVIKFDTSQTGMSKQYLIEQQDDLVQLGRTIVSLAVGNPGIVSNAFQVQQALDSQVSSAYSDRLRECLVWLISIPQADSPAKDIDTLLAEISTHTVNVLDSILHQTDTMDDLLAGSIEDGRLFRLITKINMVLERPEHDQAGPGHANWSSETGERYYLKLFRDYIFHAVDSNGRPNVDLSHVLNCLNRLDAGTSDQIQLMSKDGETVFHVSFHQMKRVLESEFNALMGLNGPAGGGHTSGGSGGKGRKS